MTSLTCAEDGVREWLNQVLVKQTRYARNAIKVVANQASIVLARHNRTCAANPALGQPSVALLISGIGRLHAVATACSGVPVLAYYLKQDVYKRALRKALDDIRSSGRLCQVRWAPQLQKEHQS